MAVPKQHRSKSRQGQRRMHIHLSTPKFIICSRCSKEVLPHTVCKNCGYYKERAVLDVLKKLTKKEKKEKKKELEAQGQAQEQSTKELSPEDLSKK